MSRWVIQCLTVVTMLASLLHGQCLFACSMQLPAHATIAPSVRSGAHACCPHTDEQKSQNSEKPCQPDSAVMNPASSAAPPATNMALPIVLLDLCGEPRPSLSSSTRHVPNVPTASSRLSLRSSISILRI